MPRRPKMEIPREGGDPGDLAIEAANDGEYEKSIAFSLIKLSESAEHCNMVLARIMDALERAYPRDPEA